MIGILRVGYEMGCKPGFLGGKLAIAGPSLKLYLFVKQENDPGALAIPFSGILENKLFEMSEEEQTAYAEANPGAKTTLDKIIVQGYKGLGLMYFFTAGKA